MSTTTEMMQQHIERIRQKQIKLNELMQPGWEDAAHYFPECEKKYGRSELRVPAVVQPQTDNAADLPAWTTFGELMESLDIVPRISQMPQGTTRPGSCHMMLSSGMLQFNTSIPSLVPSAEPDSSACLLAKHDEPVKFDPCI
jgi:hypothetical protein